MVSVRLFLLVCLLAVSVSPFDHVSHTLDPAIPTVSPHTNDASADSCAGQCAFQFMDNIRSQIGQDRASSLMQLNFNDFLTSFSNTTFFEKFCGIYHNFQNCASKCSPGFLHQLLMRSSEIIDHYCVYNFDAIRAKFPCLSKMRPNKECVKTCTPHHDAISSMTENFKNLVLSGDTTRAEQYLGQGCEYITCTLHCDVPTIAHECDYETAQLV
uniref:Chondroitin proteoglycan 4 domain-containing protein n=1 Tax=Caenorhabditis japonica TaxID=281687 RepID=A0A8R1IN25_CAEJA